MLDLPPCLFSIILPHTTRSQKRGPCRLHSKYSQGWRQSNMNFNELLNRIIYLLPPHPEPPNWQIYIAFFSNLWHICMHNLLSRLNIFFRMSSLVYSVCRPLGISPVLFESCSPEILIDFDCTLHSTYGHEGTDLEASAS